MAKATMVSCRCLRKSEHLKSLTFAELYSHDLPVSFASLLHPGHLTMALTYPKILFSNVFKVLKEGKYCVVIIQDSRRGSTVYPLHMDFCYAMKSIGYSYQHSLFFEGMTLRLSGAITRRS